MENTTKEANIIGNGFFDMTTIKSELPCVTCNFMHMELNPIATVSGDIESLTKVNLAKIPCKVVLRKFRNKHDIQKALIKDAEVTFLDDTNIFVGILNAGQAACEYLIKNGFTKLNLYGFTSRFKIDITSKTNDFTISSIGIAPIIATWNAIWDEMILHYKTVEFNFIPT